MNFIVVLSVTFSVNALEIIIYKVFFVLAVARSELISASQLFLFQPP